MSASSKNAVIQLPEDSLGASFSAQLDLEELGSALESYRSNPKSSEKQNVIQKAFKLAAAPFLKRARFAKEMAQRIVHSKALEIEAISTLCAGFIFGTVGEAMAEESQVAFNRWFLMPPAVGAAAFLLTGALVVGSTAYGAWEEMKAKSVSPDGVIKLAEEKYMTTHPGDIERIVMRRMGVDSMRPDINATQIPPEVVSVMPDANVKKSKIVKPMGLTA